MKITSLGTTTLLFDDGVDQLMLDAHITRPYINSLIFGKVSPDRALAERLARELKMDRVRAIFISHSHHDHVMDAPNLAQLTGAQVYGSSSALNVCRGGGVKEAQLHEFKARESYQAGGYKITVLPSIHSTAKWYNDNLGQPITEPLITPARKKAYKEGGSFDFILEHGGRKYLFCPSYKYIENRVKGLYGLDELKVDVLFLGVAGISKEKEDIQQAFFRETVEAVSPETVIPVHWENFFTPLLGEIKDYPHWGEHAGRSLAILARYCQLHGINCVTQLPLTSIKM